VGLQKSDTTVTPEYHRTVIVRAPNVINRCRYHLLKRLSTFRLLGGPYAALVRPY
jgi:hypothetical protein